MCLHFWSGLVVYARKPLAKRLIWVFLRGVFMSEQQQANEQQLQAWVKQQLQKANKYLAEQGILFDSVTMEDSRYLAPMVAVWKIKDTKGKRYWVITGDCPTDVIGLSAAKTAREALKYISFRWQAKAQEIVNTGSKDKVQMDYANLLVNRAEGIYDLQNNDDLWKEG